MLGHIKVRLNPRTYDCDYQASINDVVIMTGCMGFIASIDELQHGVYNRKHYISEEDEASVVVYVEKRVRRILKQRQLMEKSTWKLPDDESCKRIKIK